MIEVSCRADRSFSFEAATTVLLIVNIEYDFVSDEGIIRAMQYGGHLFGWVGVPRKPRSKLCP